MKKLSVGVIVLLIAVLSIIGIGLTKGEVKKEYLRIHIRANSNLVEDQSVKYAVKESVVEFLTPIISECKTKTQAQEALKDNLKNIQSVADRTLKNSGFSYTSKVLLKQEEFPTRTYDNLVLEAGFYDALIVELGEAKGDNWWCVVYPPLCFVGEGNNYIYKSKIADIIKKFFNIREE